MRGLYFNYSGKFTVGALSRISLNSSGGVLCPKLEWLRLDLRKTVNALPLFRLLLSPHLKRVEFSDSSVLGPLREVWLTGLVQIISVLPTSIEALTVMCGLERYRSLEDAISAFVCRSGSSLRSFYSSVPVSEVAIHHIAQLPNLRSWDIIQGPPQTSPPSISPPLEELRLLKKTALPWLRLFASHEEPVPQNGFIPVAPHANIREKLRLLECPNGTILDSTFLSPVLKFRNLGVLYMDNRCSEGEGCVFHLTDDDMEGLAAALPRLKYLQLGRPCHSNSCNTTVASLLSISTHCLDLITLETHFNTLTIAEDIRRLLDNDSGRDKSKCKLSILAVGSIPLGADRKDIDMETVQRGFEFIFPRLRDFTNYGGRWYELRTRLCYGLSYGILGDRRRYIVYD